jgi:hypothetical protein
MPGIAPDFHLTPAGPHSVTTLQSKETVMSSRGKKKTTMAKLSRESRLRERRAEKQAKKEARRQAPAVEPTQSAVQPVQEQYGA